MELKRGIYKATVRDNETIVLVDSEYAHTIDGEKIHPTRDDIIKNPRAAIVLDVPASLGGVEGLLEYLRKGHWHNTADQIEAQTKQPRIPEPGAFGVVEAGVKQHDVRLKWVHVGPLWLCENTDEYAREWDDLTDPVLIRKGV